MTINWKLTQSMVAICQSRLMNFMKNWSTKSSPFIKTTTPHRYQLPQTLHMLKPLPVTTRIVHHVPPGILHQPNWKLSFNQPKWRFHFSTIPRPMSMVQKPRACGVPMPNFHTTKSKHATTTTLSWQSMASTSRSSYQSMATTPLNPLAPSSTCWNHRYTH